MRWKTKIILIILWSFVIFHFPTVQAQNLFNGDYVLVQYFMEDEGYRRVMHFELMADGDTSGTYAEIYREQGEPDSGSFSYYLNEDRTFVIPEDEDVSVGIIDDEGDVFTLVSAGSGYALFGAGVRKSSGKTVEDLSGEYWISEFVTDNGFQAVGFDYADFDGAGTATLYRIENTLGELDTFDFAYSVNDDGTIVFDSTLVGIISPDGQFFVAGKTEIGEGESSTYVMGIKKSTGLDNSALDGSYIYNQIRTEDEGLNEEVIFFARVNFDGDGMGDVVMFLGEPHSDPFDYSIASDGSSDLDSTLGAVSTDGRYFFNVELEDPSSVAFGLGIRGEDLSTSVGQDYYSVTPSSIKLERNYPNPFNPNTIINYVLPITNDIDLSIYNVLGQKLVTLDSGRKQPGSHSVEWDASGFASGIYYYQLRTDAGIIQSKKLVLMK